MNKLYYYIKSLLMCVRINADFVKTSPKSSLQERTFSRSPLLWRGERGDPRFGEVKPAKFRTPLLKYSPLGLGAFWKLGAFLGLGALHFQAVGQKWYAPTQKEVSSGIYVSTSGQNPFWLRSNQYGIVPLESQFVTFRGGVYKDYRNNSPKQQKNNNTNAAPLNLSKGNSSNDEGLRQAQTDIRQTGTRLSQTDNDTVPLSLSKGNSSNDEDLRQAQTDIRQAGTRLSQTDNDTVTLSLSKGNSSNDEGLRQAGTRLFQTDRKFDFGYGLSAVANVGKVNQVLFPEAYLKVKYGAFEIYGGRRKEIVGLVDTTLTSGSYIWSGNALPMPKVQISIPNYTSIIGKGLISIKGALNHGWFDDNGVVKNHYLHQKWLYGKLGKNHWKINLYGGVNHQVMWGGYSEYFKLNPQNAQFPQTINGYFAPYPFYSYQYVLIPFLQKIVTPDNTKVPGYDAGLAVGNHLGSVDIAGSLNTEFAYFFIYHQHPYDFARSLYTLNNLQDGNNGIQINFKNGKIVKHILFEYLNTTSQGRYRFGQYRDSNYGEIDSYFTHGQYKGWIYHDRIIGTPFISIKNVNGSTFSDNRVRAFNLAIQGIFHKTEYTFRNSYVKHYGFYNTSYIGNFNYVFLQAKRELKRNTYFQLAIANDWSTIDSTVFGLAASFVKTF